EIFIGEDVLIEAGAMDRAMASIDCASSAARLFDDRSFVRETLGTEKLVNGATVQKAARAYATTAREIYAALYSDRHIQSEAVAAAQGQPAADTILAMLEGDVIGPATKKLCRDDSVATSAVMTTLETRLIQASIKLTAHEKEIEKDPSLSKKIIDNAL